MDLAPRALPLETIARPARVLFAWLDDELGPGVVGEGTSVRPDPAAVARASRARQLRAARSPFGGNLDAVRPLPPSLAGRAATLREVDGAPVEVRMVELARLVAVQPYAFTDVDLDLPRGDTDLERLFEVTLPSTGATDVAVGFQRAASRFIVASQNQNLQVLGEFTGPIPDAPQGSLAVGFLVAAPPSWVRVALLADRAVLLDGYHRALALLAAGIDVVPAAVEVVASFASVWSEGMLDEAVCLGDRPALVGDYLDDEVSTSTTLPHVGRAITVTAVECDLDGTTSALARDDDAR